MDHDAPPSSPPDFLPFQIARLVRSPPSGKRWRHELKFDGYRVQVRITDGKARFHTRNGHDWSHLFPTLAATARSLQDCVLDGELCALDERGAASFAALRQALASRTDDLVVFVFDVLWAPAAGDLRERPLEARKAVLRELLASAADEARERYRWVEDLAGEPKTLFQAACDMGLEGIVSKRRDGLYQAGRGDGWVKSKCRASVDAVVGGWRSVGGRLSALIVALWEADELRHVGNLHMGLDEAAIADLTPRLQALAADQPAFAFAAPPQKLRDIHWVRPELVAEIELPQFAVSGELRKGRFKGLRLDKTAADLKAEESFG